MDEQRKVQPHAFSEKSYLENVTQFIRHVVPQVVGSLPTAVPAPPISELDSPVWMAFDESGLPDEPLAKIPPMLVVGYRNGLHVWDIREANKLEVASLRETQIVCAKMLSPPQGVPDPLAGVRPVLAFVDAERPTIMQLYSLRSQELLSERVDMRAPVLRILSSPRAFAIGTKDRIRVMSAASVDQNIADLSGYSLSSPACVPNPFALAMRFLAFCTPFVPETDEFGVGEQSASMAHVVEMAQKTGSSLLSLGGYGVKKVSDMVNGPMPGPAATVPADGAGNEEAGNIMVVDVRSGATLCHFRAAHRTPIAALAFDSSGTTLATACTKGQEINVFHLGISPPNAGSAIGVVHLYTCRRGVTTANIRSISFSIDSRWLAVTSDRSTTHLFPLLPRGGPPTPRSHTSTTVLNASRFVISSGASEAPAATPAIYVESLIKLKHPIPAADPHAPATICSSTCAFGVRQLLEPDAVTSSLSYTLLVCTAAAELVEYQLHPEVTQAPGRGTLMGLVPASASGVMTTMGTMFEGMRGMVAGVVGRAPDSTVSSAAPTDTLALSYSPGRAWDLCRRRFWPPTRKATRTRPRDRERERDRDRAQEAAKADADADSAWLSRVETTTYNPPHRRLWMGPQFTFKVFRALGDSSATITAQSATHGAADPVFSDIYSRELQMTALPLLIPSEPRREDTDLAVTWAEAPQTQLLTDGARLDLSSALEDEGGSPRHGPARPAAAAASTVAIATSPVPLERGRVRSTVAPAGPPGPAAQSAHSAATTAALASLAAAPPPPRMTARPRLSSSPPTSVATVLTSSSPPMVIAPSTTSPHAARSVRTRAATTLPTAPLAAPVPAPATAPATAPAATAPAATAPAATAPAASSLPRMMVGSPPLVPGRASNGLGNGALSLPGSAPRFDAALSKVLPRGRPAVVGASPSPDDSAQGPFTSRGMTGLAVVLGDADSDARMHRVHSAVGLGGLADAMSDDDDDDDAPFHMDDHEHVD